MTVLCSARPRTWYTFKSIASQLSSQSPWRLPHNDKSNDSLILLKGGLFLENWLTELSLYQSFN